MTRLLMVYCALFSCFVLSATAQDTAVSLGGQDVEIVDADWQLLIENGERRIRLTPKPAMETAKASIQDGTEVTYYEGKEIQYTMGSDAFLIDGDARIERPDLIMQGPVQIEYTPDDMTMTVLGTERAPAIMEFIDPSGKTIVSRAIEFTLTFTDVDGSRTLRSIETRGNILTRTESEDYVADRPLMRRMSSMGS